jgi:group I intron endonuclease
MGVIYKITSPSEKVYVGKTKRLKIRIWEYRWRSKKRKSIIHDSIKGYGWDAHKFEIIEEITDELLNEREVFWIKELNTFYRDNPKGMNMTRGGDGGGVSWIHDTERRKKQSESRKGENGTFYGRHHTEETKKILSEKIKKWNLENNKQVPEWGAKKGQEKRKRQILMYDSNGIFVKEFKSLQEASKELNINRTCISDSISGKHSNAGGYIFKYKIENYSYRIDVGEIKKKTVKRSVVAIYAGEVKTFPSALEASEFFKIPKTTINRAAMYNEGRPIRTGHRFYYKDLFINNQNRPLREGRAA